MTVLNEASEIGTFPDNPIDLANIDHSRIVWLAVFVIICGVVIFLTRFFKE